MLRPTPAAAAAAMIEAAPTPMPTFMVAPLPARLPGGRTSITVVNAASALETGTGEEASACATSGCRTSGSDAGAGSWGRET